MSSSPCTPSRPRPSSSIDASFTSASSQGYGNPIRSRRSSLHSKPSPSYPRPKSSLDRNTDFLASNGPGSATISVKGLGSLADELAEAWDDDGEEEGGSPDGLSYFQDVENEQADTSTGLSEQFHFKEPSDLSVEAVSSPVSLSIPNLPTSPPKSLTCTKQRPRHSEHDGSDTGYDLEMPESKWISVSLEARMAVIEELARQGVQSNSSEIDTVVVRVANSLKNLSPQSGVEYGATCLITAYTVLTAHLKHQSRLLQTLTQPLFYPLPTPPVFEVHNFLLPLLSELTRQMPAPNPDPLSSLLCLRTSTADLLSTLSYLSDTLHMMRQTTSLASRRLRCATEMAIDMKRETEAREESIRWVERGRWEEKLAKRECARVCGEIMGGFEEVCRGWRASLVGKEVILAGVEVGAG